MKRVLIIGCGGSGKSTLARALGEKLALPVVHLDRLFWLPEWQHVSRDAFDARLNEAMQQERWILDGNYDRTLPARIPYCDTILYLDYPRRTCLWGVVQRFFSRKPRLDMTEHCPEHFDLDFLRWVLTYRTRFGAENERLLKDAEACGKTVITLHSRREAKNWLNSLQKADLP